MRGSYFLELTCFGGLSCCLQDFWLGWSLGNGDFQELLDNSFYVEITNGKLDDEVPSGTYTLTTGENYPGIFQGTNHIEIEILLDDVVRQDFDFRKCITF